MSKSLVSLKKVLRKSWESSKKNPEKAARKMCLESSEKNDDEVWIKAWRNA